MRYMDIGYITWIQVIGELFVLGYIAVMEKILEIM